MQYVGCSRVVGPKLSQESGESVAEHILRSGPKKNKRRVTITFTAEQCYITDMIYRVSHCHGILKYSIITHG